MTDLPPSAPHPMPARTPMDDEISLWEVLAVLVRRRTTIIATAFLVSVASVATGFVGGKMYTSWAAFRPQGSQQNGSDLLALANQFGVNVGRSQADEATPEFYEELLTSREILLRAAREEYTVDGVGRTGLAALLEIEEEDREIALDEVRRWLAEKAVTVSTSPATGRVTVSVKTNWPDLSQAIAANLLREVTRFNMGTRQSQAAAERRFIEARRDSAAVELLSAENELQDFLEANRQFEQAPLLRFRHDRLQRDVTLKQSVLTTLTQSYEQARISEVRDTPVVTVLQEPFFPPKRDPRGTVLRAAVGLVLGTILGFLLALVIEAFKEPAVGDPARLDFQESWSAFLRSIPFVGRRR